MATAAFWIYPRELCPTGAESCAPQDCIGGICYEDRCFRGATDFIRWQRSDDDGANWYEIPLNTFNNNLYNYTQTGEVFFFTISNLTEAKYRAKISDECFDDKYSTERAVCIDPFNANISPDKTSYTTGETPPLLSADSLSVIKSYKWQKKVGANFVDIGGATSSTYQIP